MKKFLTFLLLVFIAGGVNAQNVKFGHINTQELLGLMPERDTVAKKLDAFVKDLSEMLEDMNVELRKKYDDFEKNQATWSEAIKGAKQKDLIDMQRRIQEKQELFREDADKEQQRLFTPVIDKARNAISKVGKEQGMVYVFDISAGSIAYFNPAQSVDILPLVKKELNIK